MTGLSLFGEEELPSTPPKKGTTPKPPPLPKEPTKKQLREQAPAPQNRAPVAGPEEQADADAIRLFAQFDMLSPETLEEFSDIVEPVINKRGRERMREWRRANGR